VVRSNQDNYEALRGICERHHVWRLDLHGSTWTGEDLSEEQSDPDFLVEFLPLKQKERAKMYLALEEALEKLFGRKVSLLTIGNMKNEFLRRVLTRRRTLLYSAEDQDES